MKSVRSVSLLAIMVFFSANLVYAASEHESAQVIWGLEFSDPTDLHKARVCTQDSNGNEVSDTSFQDIGIESGVLHIGLKEGVPVESGQYLLPSVSWGSGKGWGGTVNGPLPASIPAIDAKRFPVLEIRCRVPKPFATEKMMPVSQLVWSYRSWNGEESASWLSLPLRQDGEWVTARFRLAPDSSVPGPYTPRYIDGIRLRITQPFITLREPLWYEVDYIRIQSFDEEEDNAEHERIDLLSDYTTPAIPERLKGKFFYGCCWATDTPTPGTGYVGGPEGVCDEVVRYHINYLVDFDADFSEAEVRAARDRGLYYIATIRHDVCDLAETNGLAAAEKVLDEAIVKARNLPNIIGWCVMDEPYKSSLWGTVATKILMERKDPERLALINYNNILVAAYYSRFSTIVWSDHYPVRNSGEDPWSVGRWCRSISQISSKPQWFWLQADGAVGWKPELTTPITTKYMPKCPTVEQFRLMLHSALANGAKSLSLIGYQYHGRRTLADRVGNPSVIGKEVARLGERLIAVAPLLVDAKPILDTHVSVSTPSKLRNGISIGVMGDPAQGPVFMVATNEDLNGRQNGIACLPEAWATRGRSVYDLYSLERVAMDGSPTFEIRSLDPGDGRIYMLATADQFKAARGRILWNQVEESLRVQAADRLIAMNWGLDLGAYDARIDEVRSLLTNGRHREALRLCNSRAAQTLDHIMQEDEELAKCRSQLLAIRKALGKATSAILFIDTRVRPRQDRNVEPLEKLCQRYSDLRRDYLLGHRTDLLKQVAGLYEDVQRLHRTIRRDASNS